MMKLSIVLAMCYMQAAGAAYSVFVANLAQLGSSGVTGEVTIFVTDSGLLGIGSAAGLEAGLAAGPNCTAKNGCGAHVHSGTACTNTTTQGGHYFANGTSDPWASIGYRSTTSSGAAMFSFSAATSVRDIANKPFIVHNNAGGRVACGILAEVTGLKSATLAALSSSGVSGEVMIFTTASKVVGAGHAIGLEPKLQDASSGGMNCTATNGCGVHVHSGTACDSKATQGGHYYNGLSDPWATVRYSSTTDAGQANFVFSVSNNATDVSSKPFIVHNNAGGRVACGLLGNGPSTTTTTTTSHNFVPSTSTSFKISVMAVVIAGMHAIFVQP